MGTSIAARAAGLRSQLSHHVAPNRVDLTLRLSPSRFHERNLGPNPDSKKPSKTSRFQGPVDWLRGGATTDTDIR